MLRRSCDPKTLCCINRRRRWGAIQEAKFYKMRKLHTRHSIIHTRQDKLIKNEYTYWHRAAIQRRASSPTHHHPYVVIIITTMRIWLRFFSSLHHRRRLIFAPLIPVYHENKNNHLPNKFVINSISDQILSHVDSFPRNLYNFPPNHRRRLGWWCC